MSTKTRFHLAAGCFAFLFLLFYALEIDSYARMGRGGSFGSRGTRSYSSPTRSAPSSPNRSYQSPSQPSPPGSGSSLLRGMAGGIAGGMLGSMLFSGLGFGATGATGGGGIGLFEIVILAAILYFVYRFIKKRRERAQ